MSFKGGQNVVKTRSRGKEKSEELKSAFRKLENFYKAYNELFFNQIGRMIEWTQT